MTTFFAVYLFTLLALAVVAALLGWSADSRDTSFSIGHLLDSRRVARRAH